MDVSKKQAVQGVLLDELARRQKDEPTLLFDILMGGYGRQFINQTIHARWQVASGQAVTLRDIMQELRTEFDPIEEYRPQPPPGRAEDEEQVA